MSETVGRLTVALDARIAQFETNVARAEARLTRGATKMQRDVKQIDASFEGLGSRVLNVTRAMPLLGAALAGLSVGALVTSIRSAVDAVGGLGELADQAGVSTDALQALTFAATQVGVSGEEMQRGLAALTRRIADAAGGEKEAEDAFKRLGVTFREANGAAVPTERVLVQLADRMRDITDPTERAALATSVFGDRLGQRMIPLLLSGGQGLRDMAAQALAFGAVADAELIAKADEASDKIAALQLSFTNMSRNMVAMVAPALSMVADGLNRIITGKTLAERRTELVTNRAQLQARLSEYEMDASGRPSVSSQPRRGTIQRGAVGVARQQAGVDQPALITETREQLALVETELAAMEAETATFQARADAILNPPTTGARSLPRAARGGSSGSAERDPGRNPIVAQALREQNQAIEERNRLIEQNRTPEEAYAARLARLGELVARFEGTENEVPLPTISAEAADALSDYETALRRAGEAARDTQKNAQQVGSAFESAFESAIAKGANLSTVLSGLASDLSRLALSSVWKSSGANDFLGGLFNSAVGAISGKPVASAKGNVFGGGSVVPFADGGLTTGPTMFPMAGGKTGLMGEAGIEAVMPLGRDRYGRLGVRAQGGQGGGGVTIQQTNQFASGVSRADMALFGQQIKRDTIAAVAEARRESRSFLA